MISMGSVGYENLDEFLDSNIFNLNQKRAMEPLSEKIEEAKNERDVDEESEDSDFEDDDTFDNTNKDPINNNILNSKDSYYFDLNSNIHNENLTTNTKLKASSHDNEPKNYL